MIRDNEFEKRRKPKGLLCDTRSILKSETSNFNLHQLRLSDKKFSFKKNNKLELL